MNLIKWRFTHLRKTLSKLPRMNAHLPWCQCTSSHDDERPMLLGWIPCPNNSIFETILLSLNGCWTELFATMIRYLKRNFCLSEESLYTCLRIEIMNREWRPLYISYKVILRPYSLLCPYSHLDQSTTLPARIYEHLRNDFKVPPGSDHNTIILCLHWQG